MMRNDEELTSDTNSDPGETADHRLPDPNPKTEPATTLFGSVDQSLDLLDRHLASCLERMEPECPVDHPRQLLDFLPPSVEREHAGLLLIEMIKLDMAAACDHDNPRVIEDYVSELSPPLSINTVPLDLVLEEKQLLQGRGRNQDRSIKDRFPHLAKLDLNLRKVAQTTIHGRKRAKLPELAPGEQIEDFVIVRSLGSGAFAHVYLANQVSMQRLVALKVSRGTGGESQTLAQLDHTNIVRVFDQRSIEDPPCHLLYMQYVPGGTLADVVKRVQQSIEQGTTRDAIGGECLLSVVDHHLFESAQVKPERSSVREWLSETSWAAVVAWIGVQLAQALEEAHERGVLHRDVKPANVLLSAEGIPKLADFNVSFTESLQSSNASNFGGSIAYMSPEHLRAISAQHDDHAEIVDERSDLFSLAVMLWELWQGRRPFRAPEHVDSWTHLIAQQLDARESPLVPPVRNGDASEGVLESSLRRVLLAPQNERPSRGAELAAKWKLALYPETADLFDPPADSWRNRILHHSPRLVAAIAILSPNIAAGVFNYFYNRIQIIEVYQDLDPSFRPAFQTLALIVNVIAFPAGAAMMLHFTQPIVNAITQLRNGQSVSESDQQQTLVLPLRAAVIGSLLWVIAGLVYPTVLMFLFPVFDRMEGLHFFMSLLVCGGVAAVYPYFCMLLLVTRVYYPRFQRDQLSDSHFEKVSKTIASQASFFLMAAAVIPLVGAALLLSRTVIAKGVMLTAVVLSIAGLSLAFWAYNRILSDWRKMAIALGNRTGPIVPGGDV